MTIKLAKRVQRSLPKKRFVPTVTTFVTEDGPTPGTIWFYTPSPTGPPVTVAKVADGLVTYTDFEYDRLDLFLNAVRDGSYILIGFMPEPTSHIEV